MDSHPPPRFTLGRFSFCRKLPFPLPRRTGSLYPGSQRLPGGAVAIMQRWIFRLQRAMLHAGMPAIMVRKARLDEYVSAAFLILALVPPLVVATVLWVLPVGPLDANRTALAARDYTDMWAAGHLAARGMGNIFFDKVSFNSALHAMFGPGFPEQIWPYPPPILLLAVPLSTLPLLPGFLLYTCSTLGLLWLVLRSNGFTRAACASVLLSPAVADNVLSGQNAALTATMLFGGLVLLDSRQFIAGMLLGLLVIKPQLGLLLPVCLIASGNWRALTAMAISATILIGLSSLFFGLDAWLGFFERTRPMVAAIIEAPWQASPSQRIFASPLMAARSIGASTQVAYSLQISVALICAAVAWRTWRVSSIDPLVRAAFTGLLTLAAAPWVHTYDMVALSLSVVILYPTASPRSRILLAYAWIWPGAIALLPLPLPISVGSVAAVTWLMWDQVRRGDKGCVSIRLLASQL